LLITKRSLLGEDVVDNPEDINGGEAGRGRVVVRPEYVFEVFNLARPAATVEGGCRFAFELPVLSCPIRGLGFPPNFGGIPYPGNGREEGGLTFE
jgi:hypothetical protein